jgi:D-3-phosphoglycerate dehydrogenase
MSLQIVMICDPLRVCSDFPDRIKAKGAEFLVKDCRSEYEQIAACHNADFIITVLGTYSISRPVIENLAKCRFIETLGVGYSEIDLEAATDHGIGVIHNPGFCREELSDHAMALILACSRWIVGLNNRVKMGNPITPASPEAVRHMNTLQGKTLGLIGFGNSGRAVVPKARGFAMKIMAYDPYVDRATGRGLNVEMVGLDRLLEESDFISIHANITPETRKMLGLKEFRKMKRSTFIINTSRGAIINEPDLYTALSEGYIAGAGLDVTEQEPLARDHPLLKFDNVILTGHNAGGSPDSYTAMWNFPVEEIERVIRREWPVGLVNPEVKPKFVEKWGQMSEPER